MAYILRPSQLGLVPFGINGKICDTLFGNQTVPHNMKKFIIRDCIDPTTMAVLVVAGETASRSSSLSNVSITSNDRGEGGQVWRQTYYPLL